MENSTPIDQLRGNRPAQPDNSELVQNILSDMNGQNQGPPQQKQVHFKDDDNDRDDDDEEGFEGGPYEPQLTFTEKIVRELKTPLLVMLLVFLTNYPFFTKMLQQNIPNVLTYAGDFGLIGVKALFAGIVYYLVVRYAF